MPNSFIGKGVFSDFATTSNAIQPQLMLELTYKGPQQTATTATETHCVVFVVLLFHNQIYYFSFIILTLFIQTLFDYSHVPGRGGADLPTLELLPSDDSFALHVKCQYNPLP